MVYPPQRVPPTDRTSAPTKRASGAAEHTPSFNPITAVCRNSIYSTTCHTHYGRKCQCHVLFCTSINKRYCYHNTPHQLTAKRERRRKEFVCRCDVLCEYLWQHMSSVQISTHKTQSFRPGRLRLIAPPEVPSYLGRSFFGLRSLLHLHT